MRDLDEDVLYQQNLVQNVDSFCIATLLAGHGDVLDSVF